MSEGVYWSAGTPMTLAEVRPLAGPKVGFADAAAAFLAKRAQRLRDST